MNSNELAKKLQIVVAVADKGDVADAEARCRKILADHPSDPDALQLMGIILKKKGDLDQAEAYLQQSLKVKHNQPHIWNILSDIYNETGDIGKAEAAYRIALKINPENGDTIAGLSMLLLDTGGAEEAKSLAEKLIDINPQDARGHCLLGQALESLQDLEAACTALVQAVKRNPEYFEAQYHLGRVLRNVGLPEQAAERYLEAIRINPDSAELYHDFGYALYDLGHIESAIQAYRQAIHIKPDFLEAHNILNNLYWEHKQHDLFLQSYRNAMEQMPEVEGLAIACADKLSHISQHEEAALILNKAMDRALEGAGISAALAHAIARSKVWAENWDEGFSWFDKSIALGPENVAVYQDYAQILIKKENCQKAYGLIEKARQLAPNNQETIAYEWLCLRLLGKPGAEKLYDYDRFVRVFNLRCPDGYEDISAFNRALAAHLHTLHTTDTHPFDQTLRFGTQTHGFLFDSQNPLIQQVQKIIQEAVDQYVRDIPDEPGHPFLGRNGNGGFTMAGSWSVRLGKNGHHFNHTHSRGWISSAYYVEMPDDLDDAQKEGWIKFGESNLDLGEREEIGKTIRPTVGKLVLFPSYMYHGTVPIKSSRPRMTIAFDVLPG